MIRFAFLFGEIAVVGGFLLSLFWTAQLCFGSREDIVMPIWLSHFLRRVFLRKAVVAPLLTKISSKDSIAVDSFSLAEAVLDPQMNLSARNEFSSESREHASEDEAIVRQILLARKRIIEDQIAASRPRILSESETTRELRKNILRDNAAAKDQPRKIEIRNVITENMLQSMQTPQTIM